MAGGGRLGLRLVVERFGWTVAVEQLRIVAGGGLWLVVNMLTQLRIVAGGGLWLVVNMLTLWLMVDCDLVLDS